MTALEKEAGIALLERTGRGVRPTEAGRLLAGYATAIGKQVSEAETALADLRAGRTGTVSVCYFATAGATVVAPALAELRREHPGVHVDLRRVDPYDPLPEVREGRADLALVVRPPGQEPVEGIRFVHLVDDHHRAVLPEGHPLTARRVLELSDLAGEPWVGSEWPGPCLDAVLDACATAGFAPDFVVQSEDYATAQGFVAAGLGISLIPATGLSTRHPDVVVREVRNPRPVRSIYAAVRDSAPDTPALRALFTALHHATTAPPPHRQSSR
jgi:DNA-binding transcriptional LysR family regulator